MAFLQAEQLESLTIERMIFHVVGPASDELVLLEEIDPTPHADFFIERLQSANTGIMFDFLPGSSVLASLSSIDQDPKKFPEESRRMAALFNEAHGKNTSRGVFFVFSLRTANERFYAVVKYDHETVLSYTIEETRTGARPLIERLQDTFVQSPQALQKTAIIKLSNTGGELCVKDRVAPTLVTNYFRGFLGAHRRYTEADLTTTLAEVTKKVAKECSSDLSGDAKKAVTQRLYDTLQTQTSFDPGNAEVFLTSVFGPLEAESNLRKSFERHMRARRVDGEAFNFDRQAIPRPSKRRIVTTEGIQVIWDREYSDIVSVQSIAGGQTRITITTGGVEENDDYTESNSRRR
ncbi:nucleoid-associated protein [Terriglobus sp. ADX1]|uniref:nucleoid-associated protein n=1 Tax=Terriglobus sp. ADX1 TaxID=2794063 RepID=UPI002FE5D64E